MTRSPFSRGRMRRFCSVTIQDIADFCEFTDCGVSVGGPEAGFIHIDGTGLRSRSYTWGRFNMLHEVNALPSPRQALEKATVFQIKRGESLRSLTREEFEQELESFRRKVG